MEVEGELEVVATVEALAEVSAGAPNSGSQSRASQGAAHGRTSRILPVALVTSHMQM